METSDVCDSCFTSLLRTGKLRYKEEYIDEIAAVLRTFSGTVEVVLVIEPDSLPNLSTYLDLNILLLRVIWTRNG